MLTDRDFNFIVSKHGILKAKRERIEKLLEDQRKELIAQFREFAPELISRFGFDDQMDHAIEFTKKRFTLYTEGVKE